MTILHIHRVPKNTTYNLVLTTILNLGSFLALNITLSDQMLFLRMSILYHRLLNFMTSGLLYAQDLILLSSYNIVYVKMTSKSSTDNPN